MIINWKRIKDIQNISEEEKQATINSSFLQKADVANTKIVKEI